MACDHKEHKWWEERNLSQKVLMGIGFGILGVGLFFGFGWVLMLLWNWLMPEIFGLKTVSYWQAWGLLLLSCILFQGIRPGGGHGGHHRRKDRRRYKEMHHHMHDIHHGADNADSGFDSGDVPIQDDLK